MELANILQTIISFVVIISIVVFVHEYGHYIVAKKSGVKIEIFSIGFGPKLCSWYDKSGTIWKICLLPFGGYVKMFGDKGVSSQPNISALNKISKEERDLSFHYKPLSIKAAIVAAGPIANYVLAIVLLTFSFSYYGVPYSEPIINDIQGNSRADKAGIKVGDKIISIDGHKIEKFPDIQPIIAMNGNRVLDITIERDGQIIDIKATPELIEQEDGQGNKIKIGKLGISSKPGYIKKYNIFQSFKASLDECWLVSSSTLSAIGQIITGTRSASELSGPIRIAKYSAASFERGIQVTLWFIAMLSINLGLVNLLPIPMLDGGHLFFYFFEAISGKAIPGKLQKYSFIAGLIIIIGLSIFAIFNDIINIGLL
jgi:regulator of sigma E protease